MDVWTSCVRLQDMLVYSSKNVTSLHTSEKQSQ